MLAPTITIKIRPTIERFQTACLEENISILIPMLNMAKGKSFLFLDKAVFFRRALNHLLYNVRKIDVQYDSKVYDYIDCLIESPTLKKIIEEENISQLNSHFSYMVLLRKDKLLTTLLGLKGFKGLDTLSLEQVLSKPHFAVVGKLLTNPSYRVRLQECLETSETQNLSLFFQFASFNQQDLIKEMVGLIVHSNIDIVGCLLDAIPQEDKFIIHLIEGYDLPISPESLFILCEKKSPPFSRELIEHCFNKYKRAMLPTADLSTLTDQKGSSLFETFLKTNNENRNVLELLEKYFPELLRMVNARGENTLMVALYKKRYDVASFLLSMPGIALDVPSSSGVTARQILNQLQQSLRNKTKNALTDEIVSKEAFDIAVSRFLNCHHLESVEAIFTEGKLSATHFLRLFLLDPLIGKYLARVNFKINGQGSLADLSQYEQAFYQAAQKYHFPIPFRSDHKVSTLSSIQTREAQQDFLSRGTEPDTVKLFYYDLEKTAVAPDSEFIYFDYPDKSSLCCTQALSVLQWRTNTFLNDNGYAFIISFCQDPEHIQCVLSVVDAYNQEIPITIVFNTSEDNIFFLNLAQRIKDGLEQEHPLAAKKIIFLNSSLNVQTDPADKNCAIYTLDIAVALYDVLVKNVALREMLTDPANYTLNNLAIIKLKLLAELMRRLPQYFKITHQGFFARPWEELSFYFAKRRWSIGRDYILKQIEGAKSSIASLNDTFKYAQSLEAPQPSLSLAREAPTFLPSRRRLSADKEITLQQPLSDNRPLKERLRSITLFR